MVCMGSEGATAGWGRSLATQAGLYQAIYTTRVRVNTRSYAHLLGGASSHAFLATGVWQ